MTILHHDRTHVLVDEQWSTQPPPNWAESALCAQVDSEVFFPSKGGSTTDAKRVCSHCDVRAECLTDVMRTEDRLPGPGGFTARHGVYGGLSPKERVKLARSGWRSGDPIPDVRLRGEAA